MDQFGLQAVDLVLVISFLQLVNQTVTYPEVLLHKHIVLPLSSRVGLVLRDDWHLGFLAQQEVWPWMIERWNRLVLCFLEIDLPDSLS